MWLLDILQFLPKARGAVPQHSEVEESILPVGVVRQTKLSKKFG